MWFLCFIFNMVVVCLFKTVVLGPVFNWNVSLLKPTREVAKQLNSVNKQGVGV